MTTDHPANGPVSLDRLHQISEILSKAAEQSDGGNLGYAMADAVKVIDGVISAEPVGEVSEQRDGLVMDGTVDLGGTSTHRIIKGASKMKRFPIGTKFYITPPAPVVPGNKSITQHFDTIVLEVATEIMCDVNRRHEFLGGDVQLLSRIQCRIDEACRAAMLQAGNSPATPDGWIPVSDRMPYVGKKLALYGRRAKEDCAHYVDEGYLGSNGFFYFFDWEGGPRIDDCHNDDKATVTHWMYWELPAAPHQEVKNV
ncbi:DUF551 domain-containing protein [Salmonella enterica]|nr:DUF551 domain-containing protein [Salmonella enterica]EBG9877789.1 DUF551 domain-containing protein [Salmonella enterica]MDT77522.1 DUF551 domain-containing protein [Salmonella enterica]